MIAREIDELWLQAALETYSKERSPALRDQIQEHADWLAIRSARRFLDAGEQFDDLVQVARLGLFKAIERYDPQRGIPFGAYATPTILGELKRHFRDHTWSVHVPRRAKDLRPSVNLTIQELTPTLSRAPKIFEIAQRLDVSEEAVLEALDANNAYRSSSLDSPRSTYVAWSDDETEAVVDKEVVARLLSRMPEREQRVLRLRFYDELSQTEIAERIGTSQVHVGRILALSLERLRTLASEDS